MRALLLTLGLLLAMPASAQDLGGQLHVELGTLANRDPGWELFSDNDTMGSRGVRGGLRLGEYVGVVGGWHRVRKGASVSVPAATGNGDISRDQVVMAYFADEFSLGAQLGKDFADLFRPYAGVDGMLVRGTMKLDEDSDTKRNPGQVLGRGLSPGLLLLGGGEFHSATTEDWGFTIGLFVEVGYSWFLAGQYDDVGPMKPGGLTTRIGAGVAF